MEPIRSFLSRMGSLQQAALLPVSILSSLWGNQADLSLLANANQKDIDSIHNVIANVEEACHNVLVNDLQPYNKNAHH